jgi:RNA polymerase sigma-70 factor (ECF subfamily)
METIDAKLTEFNKHRGLLFSIAYRMLGSVADAEDIVQDAFLRWHGAHTAGIQSTRAFLVTIVSRLAINHLQSARVQREEYVGQWLPEPVVPDSLDPSVISMVDESLSIAFLVLLERLSPLERAVFLLREVFDYEYSEVAPIVGKDEANCRQIFYRARRHMAEMRPRFDASIDEQHELLRAFLEATSTGNLSGLVALLATDAGLHSDGGGRAPAVPNLVSGAEKVARAILGGVQKLTPPNLALRMTVVNGAPGVVSYLDGRPFSVLTLDIRHGHIQTIYIVTNPDKLAHIPALPDVTDTPRRRSHDARSTQ